ncbi:hypothetical protein Tco_0451655 [Tanacetum coccineum]
MLYDGCGDLVAFYAINVRRLSLALLVYTLVRPLMTTSVVNNSVFRGFFEKQKLTEPNFIDWYQQLRIVLSVEDKLDYQEQPIPPAPVPAQPGQQVAPKALAAHAAWVKISKEIAGLMLMTLNLGVSLILISLRKEFDGFVQNYNMHSMGKRVNDLHAMLKLHEQTLAKKDHTLHAIRAGNYLAELLKTKKLSQGASGLGIFTIELYAFPNKSWVYDTGCGTHICNTTQGLRGSRKLKLGVLSLYVGNGLRAAIEAIRSYHLCLPNGLVIVLNNYHYAPFITRGIILVSLLYDDGYVDRFMDNTISVSRNNIVYFSVIPRDGIFEIDFSNSNTNDSSMYVVNNKRAKLNLDSTLLWHYYLDTLARNALRSYNMVDFLIQLTLGLLKDASLSFWDYALETVARILNIVPTKKVEKTSYEVWHGSIRTRHSPDRMCLYVDAEEYKLGDLENEVWDLVDLPSNGKTVGSKWLFKKKTDMDGAVHTFKAPSGSNVTFLILYVNDILIMGNHIPMLQDVKSYLGRCFAMKDLELRVSCYTDVGYLTDADDLKSQTRYVFVLNEGAVDWKSTKQSIFVTSSAEAEYITAYDASKEAVWVRKFIFGLGVIPTIKEPINMYYDNTGAITVANESGITKGARHFRAKVHYLREVIEYGDIKLKKVHTDNNLVDPFTKALAFPKHSEHTRNIRMLPDSSLICVLLVFR